MGTRADFYIKRTDNKPMEWLGSIAWDGYEIGNVGQSKSTRQYLSRLKKFLADREDATYPKDGWPWPWNNSKLTDCTYVFIKDQVYKYYERIGDYQDHTQPLLFCPFDFRPYDEAGEVKKRIPKKLSLLVPDMSAYKNVTYGKRSGILLIGA